MLRDRLVALAPSFEDDGYCLTDLATHNLGSMNRLIMLRDNYIELMGWPQGQPPARKDIADSPAGLDALVFRSTDALQTYEHLKRGQFDVKPVTHLERPIVIDGKSHVVSFRTVHFATQPIPGFRVYFCQHLTPEYVWMDRFMRHANGARALDAIRIRAAQPEAVAQTLAGLAQASMQVMENQACRVVLPNLGIDVVPGGVLAKASIEAATLADDQGRRWLFDARLH
ncbi:hypothetical protein CEY11_22430 [Candidimonas nitroreducens]|uniref:Glyoxalase-like domain-containing protein n=2 Tax=Candidimonas nitroreducens TaxID=683354 RepID=A0A225M1F3_9BURK|nr:hypothetical protein CEY11_22430 [Candidimonas nitroreducens]